MPSALSLEPDTNSVDISKPLGERNDGVQFVGTQIKTMGKRGYA